MATNTLIYDVIFTDQLVTYDLIYVIKELMLHFPIHPDCRPQQHPVPT